MRLQILIALLILFCSSCHEKRVRYQDTNLSTPVTNLFISEWTYGFLFYSCELVINRDGSFKFHDRGCMGHRYSEGNWIQIGDKTFSLKSLEKFKENEEPKVVEVESVDHEAAPTEKGNYSLDKIACASRTNMIKLSDTTNIYFDNVRLILSDEFLYCPDPDGFMGGAIFTAKKNYR